MEKAFHFSKQTPYWFRVKFSGQVSVHVKLFSTNPFIHPVQLSIVAPKQYVQLPSHALQVFVEVSGYVAEGHTYRHIPFDR